MEMMMSKLEAVIIRHEKARELVSTLNEKRRSLVSDCEGLDTTDDNHGQLVGVGQPCGVEALKVMEEENKHLHWDEQLTFYDVFFG
jgi:hypothetical protein